MCVVAWCWLRRYFFENSHGIFTLFTLPVGIPEKTKLYPRNFHEIVLTTISWKFQRLARHTIPGNLEINSTCFLDHPVEILCLF